MKLKAKELCREKQKSENQSKSSSPLPKRPIASTTAPERETDRTHAFKPWLKDGSRHRRAG